MMSFEDPSADELRILAVLVDVCGQYMPGNRLYISHDFMSAGQHVVDLLAKYGLVQEDSCGGSWTTKANLLDELDDIGLANLDEIMSRFRELPPNELLTVQPGERQHRCDVQLHSLGLWLPGRAAFKYMDKLRAAHLIGGEWLDVEARLNLGTATATIQGEILTVPQIRAFRDHLAKLVAGSTRRVHLLAYKNCLEVKVWAKRGGSFSGEITVNNPMLKCSTRSEFKFEDDFHLKSTVAQLDGVLAKLSA